MYFRYVAIISLYKRVWPIIWFPQECFGPNVVEIGSADVAQYPSPKTGSPSYTVKHLNKPTL